MVLVVCMLGMPHGTHAARRRIVKDLPDSLIRVTADNLTQTIQEYDVLMVEFYAPWCGHCAELAPEYAAAAKELAEGPDGNSAPLSHKLAVIDATKNEKVTEEYAITAFPTLLIFHKTHPEQPERYFGENKQGELVDTVLRHAYDEHWKPPRDHVLRLTPQTFDSAVKEADPILVAFVAPWCKHCQALKPVLSRASQLAAQKMENPVPIATVDCEAHDGLCAEQDDIEGYPTLKLFRKGRAYPYDGPRTSEVEIVRHLDVQNGPAAGFAGTAQRLKEVVEGSIDFPTVVAFLQIPYVMLAVPGTPEDPARPDETLQYAFFEVANQLRTEYPFAFANLHVAEELGIDLSDSPDGAIALVQQPHLRSEYEPWYHVFSTDRVPFGDAETSAKGTVQALTAFLEEKRVGLLGIMHGGNGKWYKDVRPMVAVYSAIDYSNTGPKKRVTDKYSLSYTRSQYWRNKVLPVAAKYKDSGLVFAMVNGRDFVKHGTELGMTEVEGDVRVAIWGKDSKYRLVDEEDPASTEFSMDAFQDFVAAFVAGDAEPYVHSQPVPKRNPPPGSYVRTIVAKNANTIDSAVAKGTDVLLELYAPWCTHCKTFAPKLEKLAKMLRKEPNLVIAKMDGDANDVPSQFPLEAYPSLYLQPGTIDGEDLEPVKYEGDLEVSAVLKWLKSNTATKLQHKGKKKKSRKGKKKRSKKGGTEDESSDAADAATEDPKTQPDSAQKQKKKIRYKAAGAASNSGAGAEPGTKKKVRYKSKLSGTGGSSSRPAEATVDATGAADVSM